ncbi:hypothetical protein [Mycolicibacterium sp. YH-1]|uniref:hypothetical protein n=1 Tax=Mycolicibacterium sp. YH-1 TaxID=2908837 RepID=UPI001F4BEEAC|nr:hypothetical protein [Mycolicibacterium sp. YH-1]UNB50137.1 hypothetical protein L0M16_19305 [Mycolicibacterium sp. YH-1]
MVALFCRAGYCLDGRPARPLTESVTVYRGATRGGRFGMAWTTHRDVAERFAGQPGGQVWATTVEPLHLLAYVNDPRNPEHQYVVDPRIE